MKWATGKDGEEIAAFLSENEPCAVSAYAKFLEDAGRKVWVLRENSGIIGVIVRSGRTLYPVFGDFGKESKAFFPHISAFLKKAVLVNPLYAIHGVARDVELLERHIARFGVAPSERALYDFMSLDAHLSEKTVRVGPVGLILRRPGNADMDALFQLQAAYEKEEVLLKNSAFDPAVCRMILERILNREQIMIAELSGALVGKINTSASTPSTFRLGGVYVSPAFRGRGIATRMTALFSRSLLEAGKGIGLFVKKNNAQARAVYARVGFKTLTDYRITYY
jgi:predicted GNAT family acetyltransferase